MDRSSLSPSSAVLQQVPESLLVDRAGGEMTITAKHSHYLDPIAGNASSPHGRSRRWGDIDEQGQRSVVRLLVSEAQAQGMSREETAFVLALARTESGFNPDAAAQSSSATGVGQFIDKTGEAYGITSKNRFNPRANVRATVEHVGDLFHYVKNRFGDLKAKDRLAYTYAVYHDGPSLKHGGLDIAEKRVMPWVKRFSVWLGGKGK